MEKNKEIALVPTKEEFEIIQVMAKTAFDSKFFGNLGGIAGIFSICLYAREIDIPPMTALMGGMHNVQGKITISSEMMNSLIRQKGHKLEILECTNEKCTIRGTRKDTGESYTSCFTIEDARKANLVKQGGGYDKYADDMLFARCISKLRRRLFPDVASRAYVHGEIEEEKENVNKHTGEVTSPMALIESPKDYIEPEIAMALDAIIEENISPHDPDYRPRALKALGISSFEFLEKKDLDQVHKKNAKKIEQIREKTAV